MITANNYYSQIDSLGVSQLPPTLLKSHELINKVTQEGKSWETYNGNVGIKRMIDLYLTTLNKFVSERINTVSPGQKKIVAPQTKVHQVKPQKEAKIKNVAQQKVNTATQVEQLEDEIKFIKRFTLLNGKSKTAQQVLTFINSLQKAIIERRIRKTSPFAQEIKIIQEKLIQTYNAMGTSIVIQIKPETMAKMIGQIKAEMVMPSVRFIKRYVGLQGKIGIKLKAKKLLDDMKKAVKKGILVKTDKYADKINLMHISLHNLLYKPQEHDALDISKYELNGLVDVLNGCGCHGLGAVDNDEQQETKVATKSNKIMNSVDFANMQFDSIGFTGKWLDFIGDPSKGFTAMVFGRPKMGKSYLCIDFAGYLARNHGKVLYVAKEEQLDATLQKKLNDTDVKHPNLDVSDYLPDDLSGYNFVFIDSVNKMKLEPADLDKLKANNPGVSFIYVFQSTKGGNFRGSNHFQHDVDVVIEIPEKGKAEQNGRFNQGGEMQIFDNVAEELSGVSKKRKTAGSKIPSNVSSVSRFPDWTEPEDLSPADWRNLKIIKKYYDEGEYGEAMHHAMYNSDTEVREAVPPNVWLEIGGSLTATGRERLKLLLETYPEK